MKKIIFSIAGCFICLISICQTSNPAYSSVKKWTGTCTVTVTDSLPGDVTQYVFSGNVDLVDEVHDGHTQTWPRLLMPASATSPNASPQELLKVAKQMEERSMVWNATISAQRRVLNSSGSVQKDDYVCSSETKEKLKFTLSVLGDSIIIDPGVEYSGFVNCTGTANTKQVDAQQFLSLNSANYIVRYGQSADQKEFNQLKGSSTRRVNNSWIVIEWDLTADMAND